MTLLRIRTLSVMILSLITVCGYPQDSRIPPAKDLVTYKLPGNPIYKKGWIDFNKNGKMDV